MSVSSPKHLHLSRIMSVVFIDTVTTAPAQLAISMVEIYQYSVHQALSGGSFGGSWWVKDQEAEHFGWCLMIFYFFTLYHSDLVIILYVTIPQVEVWVETSKWFS